MGAVTLARAQSGDGSARERRNPAEGLARNEKAPGEQTWGRSLSTTHRRSPEQKGAGETKETMSPDIVPREASAAHVQSLLG